MSLREVIPIPLIKLFCADLSMNRPGFSILHCDTETRTVKLIRKSVVDNKGYKGGKKPHGQRLVENANELRSYMDSDMELIFVRERGFYKSATETEVIFKMVGVSDLYAWKYEKTFEEISPTAIKRILTGNAKADKDEVAAALEPYVGKQDYAFDDESDSVAVGLAWLIMHNYIDPPNFAKED